MSNTLEDYVPPIHVQHRVNLNCTTLPNILRGAGYDIPEGPATLVGESFPDWDNLDEDGEPVRTEQAIEVVSLSWWVRQEGPQ